jgi:hypothetical protein
VIGLGRVIFLRTRSNASPLSYAITDVKEISPLIPPSANRRRERRQSPHFLNGERFDLESKRVLSVAFEMVCIALRTGRTVPIVMAQGIDPVGNGFVESLARPDGNITGFIQFEYGLAGKWMELLKEVAPGIRRVGVLREPGPADEPPLRIASLAVLMNSQSGVQSHVWRGRPIGGPKVPTLPPVFTRISLSLPRYPITI